MLGGVRIHRYRGIEQLDLRLRPLTLIVGENNSGKSTLLQAIGADPFYPGEEEREVDGVAELTPFVDLSSAPELRGLEARARTMLAKECQLAATRPGRGNRLARVLGSTDLVYASIPDGDSGVFLFRNARLVTDMETCLAERPPADSLLGRLLSSSTDEFILVSRVDVPVEIAAPSVVTIRADPDDVTELLNDLVIELLHYLWAPLANTDQEVLEALRALDQGRLRPAVDCGLVEPLVTELERRANSIAPSFIGSAGTVLLQIEDGPDSGIGRIRSGLTDLKLNSQLSQEVMTSVDRMLQEPIMETETFDLTLDVALQPEGHPRHRDAFSHLGRGTRRWISASFAEAARRLTDELRQSGSALDLDVLKSAKLDGRLPVDLARERSPVLFVIDEPAEGLHPLAQHELVQWLETHVAQGDQIVATSHHARLLETSGDPQSVSFVGVRRSRRRISVSSLSGPDLADFEALAEDFGLTRRDVLLVARGLLIVEGKDDLQLIDRIYGRVLDAAGIIRIQAGGSAAEKILSLLDSQPIRLLGLTSWVLFDKTRLRIPTEASLRSNEEKDLIKILDEAQKRGLPVEPLSFPVPDVICGLHHDLFWQVVGQRGAGRRCAIEGQPWNMVLKAWDESDLTFKEWLYCDLLEYASASRASRSVMANALKRIDPGDRSAASSFLGTSIAQLLRSV